MVPIEISLSPELLCAWLAWLSQGFAENDPGAAMANIYRNAGTF
jgi:hypothetical protein